MSPASVPRQSSTGAPPQGSAVQSDGPLQRATGMDDADSSEPCGATFLLVRAFSV